MFNFEDYAIQLYEYMINVLLVYSFKKFFNTHALRQTDPNLTPGALVSFSQNARIKFSARSVGDTYKNIIHRKF